MSGGGTIAKNGAFRSPAIEAETAYTSDGEQPEGYDEVFSRLSERVRTGDRIAANERENAPMRFAELLACSSADRSDLIRADERFHSFLLAEMLLERSREARSEDDLPRARESAELAVEVAKKLDEKFYGRELKIGLEMRAWSTLGNSLRLQGNLRGAEAVFANVDRLTPAIAPDSVERTDALSFRVSFLTDQNRLEEAQAVLQELTEIYRATENPVKLGKTLIQYGLVQERAGDLDSAIESQVEALRLLRESGDDRLSSFALGNLANCLEKADRSEEALKFLGQAREWMEESGTASYLARARWLEGRIAASLGQDKTAEDAFIFVRKFFTDRAVSIEAAAACFDLALLYCRQDRIQELKRLATEMVPIFERQGLDRQVMAALILFQHAAEKEIVTLGLVQEIVAYVKRTQSHSSS